ncbi:MAG: hypothetical protein H0X33_12350 [Taibaiella sp.]|nr:hypothetical protein [Taibaiella sp.]
MSQKLTNAEQIRAQYSANTMAVCYLTGMSEDDLKEFMYQTGLAWLRYYTNDNPEVLAEVLQRREVWGWWRNQWCRRDGQLLEGSLYRKYPHNCASWYRKQHQDVFSIRTPMFNLLESGYAVAINNMNKNLQKKERI